MLSDLISVGVTAVPEVAYIELDTEHVGKEKFGFEEIVC
jgi:hypothetical protein